MRIAINGFGRIGRGVLRALYESGYRKHIEIVAINEPADFKSIVHLTKYDSVHGRFPGVVEGRETDARGTLNIQFGDHQDAMAVFHETDLSAVDWDALQIDVLLECSGSIDVASVQAVLDQQPTMKALFSRPMLEDEVDVTVVCGVNQAMLTPQQRKISAGSCTSNAIVPVMQAIDDAFGIEYATSTTMHSLMNDQPVLDAYHNTNLRKTRAASHSMIPVNTELAKGVERILPHLRGRVSAQAIRVPTLNVSAIDLSVVLRNNASVEQINHCLLNASRTHAQGIIDVSDDALASCDFNHRIESAIIDVSQTRMSGGNLLKVWIWFDNEWAYAHRMLDLTHAMTALSSIP
ncbi:MAG: glyceraldehyde 3-phosphate dehydrogenase NAD-binding domain-containing protein [Pseudomonadota bacterium]